MFYTVSEYEDIYQGSHDTGDPLTTNLYVGNIHPQVSVKVITQLKGTCFKVDECCYINERVWSKLYNGLSYVCTHKHSKVFF